MQSVYISLFLSLCFNIQYQSIKCSSVGIYTSRKLSRAWRLFGISGSGSLCWHRTLVQALVIMCDIYNTHLDIAGYHKWAFVQYYAHGACIFTTNVYVWHKETPLTMLWDVWEVCDNLWRLLPLVGWSRCSRDRHRCNLREEIQSEINWLGKMRKDGRCIYWQTCIYLVVIFALSCITQNNMKENQNDQIKG